MKYIFTFLVVLFLLAGCSHSSLVSAYKLRNVEPENTDLHKLRVAAKVPKQFSPGPQSVYIQLRITNTSNNSKQIRTFILVPDPDSLKAPELASYRSASSRIYAYRLASKDIPRFDRMRKKKKSRSNSNTNSRELSIGVKSLCNSQHRLPKTLPVSTFLKVAETGEFVPLTLDMDILSEISHDDIKKLTSGCTGKQH